MTNKSGSASKQAKQASIIVIAVGKMKQDTGYLKAGIDEFLKRLSHYAPTEIIEVADEIIRPTITPEQVMAKEAERILQMVDHFAGATVIALSERGQAVSSEELATKLIGFGGGNQPNGGVLLSPKNPIIFIIGGALGLSPKLLQGCDWVLALSRMTFPHQMVRLILLEQVYRAFKIARNEPYHK